MNQSLLLGVIIALAVATFWISTRLAMKSGVNVPSFELAAGPGGLRN